MPPECVGMVEGTGGFRFDGCGCGSDDGCGPVMGLGGKGVFWKTLTPNTVDA